MRILRAAPLLACILAAGALAAGDAETSGTLTITAFDFQGDPVSGARFHLQRGTRAVADVETSATGLVTVALRAPDEVVRVSLAGSAFVSADPVQVSNEGTRQLVFSLFNKDVDSMSADERSALAGVLDQIVCGRAAAVLATRPSLDARGRPLPIPERLVPFLAGTRQEERDDVAEADELSTQTASIRARVVSPHGQPLAEQIVTLRRFDDSTGRLQLAGTERTNTHGLVIFPSLAPNHFYRAEAATDAGLIARSAILRPAPREMDDARTLAPRQPGESVSGLLFDDDQPVAGATLWVGGRGQPRLDTTTDEFGYFAIAPVRPGRLVLHIIEPRRDGSERRARRTLNTNAGREVFLDMRLLADNPEAE